jgi:hypothetical protein
MMILSTVKGVKHQGSEDQCNADDMPTCVWMREEHNGEDKTE